MMRTAWVYLTGFVGALLGAFLALFFVIQSDLFNAASRNLDPWVVPVAVAAFVGPVLTEVAPGWTPEEVQALTEAELVVSEELAEITL